MAIGTPVIETSGAATASVTSVTSSSIASPPADSLYVVSFTCFKSSGTTDTSTTCVYNGTGLTMSLVEDHGLSDSRFLRIYVGYGSPSASNTFTVASTTETWGRYCYNVISVGGASGTLVNSEINGLQTTDDPYVLTFSAGASSSANLLLGLGGIAAGASPDATAKSGWTDLGRAFVNGNATNEVHYLNGVSDTTSEFSWGTSNLNKQIAYLEIAPAAAASGGMRPLLGGTGLVG
jgi:hypothetical protein